MRRRIALLGMPNTGKSTFFNRLTGAGARTGNWPGVTVDLLTARLILGGDVAEVVDLPGIYDLRGFSDDEKVVRDFLAQHKPDAVFIVLNGVQLQRQLLLALQLQALGIPAVLLLNMSDEMRQLGIRVDMPALQQALNMPVLSIAAKRGEGLNAATEAMTALLARTAAPTWQFDAEHLPFDDTALRARVRELADACVQVPRVASEQLNSRLDKVLLHPVAGLPLFFAVMYLLFQAVYTVSAPLQDGIDWLLSLIREQALLPALTSAPAIVRDFLVNGLFDGFATVAAFVPVIVLFFIFMALIEDTGYFSRAAYLMDAFMSKLGLDGRSFVMVLMGFGCNVPALMGTRVMRSRSMRLLSMLIIPFSLCSARLQVFLFLTTIMFTRAQAPLVLFSLYMLSIATACGSALLFRKRFQSSEPFVLEMPPYRLPTLRQIVLRGWLEVRHFLRRATTFIVIGVVLVWLLTHFPPGVTVAGPESWAGRIGDFLSPVLDPIGINGQLAIALIFGFVAKEIVVGAMAVIYGMEGLALEHHIAASMDWVQAYSFMIFTLVYTPCLATIATLYNESRSRGFALFSLLWSLGLAWLMSFVFYQAARALGY